MVSPQISSLSELNVSISDDARQFLENQLKDLYEPSKMSDTDARKNDEAKQHLDRILEAMKLSPHNTLCRINLILANRESVIKELQEIMDPWRQKRLNMLRSLKEHSENKLLDDEGNIALQIDAHPIFDDCIEIKWRQQNETSKTAKGLVMSSVHRYPPRDIVLDPQKIALDRLSSMMTEKRDRRIELGWPDTHRVVICDRLCGEAVLRGSDIFVRGILCADSGVRLGEEVAIYADLNKKGSKISRGILLEQYDGHCVFLGTGVAGCSRAEMFNQLEGIGVHMSEGVCVSQSDLPPLNGVLTDKMMLQNLPSVVVAAALQPKQGEVILDMCAAPGGKTSHIASLVRNDALIIACDKSRKKVLNVRENLKIRGASCVVPLAIDSTHIVLDDGSARRSVKEIIESATKSPKDGLLEINGFYPESFDRILLDPPCSALGLRPKLYVQTKAKEMTKHADYQKMFIHKAVLLLKPGGTMTYSTCTFNAAENEDMIRYILDKFSFMRLVPIDYKVGSSGLPGRGLNDVERDMVCRFDPSGTDDTMGFFVAKFVKAR